jgi:hypothetical protein
MVWHSHVWLRLGEEHEIICVFVSAGITGLIMLNPDEPIDRRVAF